MELVNTFDAEMSQLEAARRIYSQVFISYFYYLIFLNWYSNTNHYPHLFQGAGDQHSGMVSNYLLLAYYLLLYCGCHRKFGNSSKCIVCSIYNKCSCQLLLVCLPCLKMLTNHLLQVEVDLLLQKMPQSTFLPSGLFINDCVDC